MLTVVEPVTTVRIDTPAGLVTAQATVAEGRVQSVRFQNVPSFVLSLDDAVDVPGIGTVHYDLAFGGAFYAFVRVEDVGLACSPHDFRRLIEKGMAIKKAVMASRPITHPFEEDLSFLYGTIFVDVPQSRENHSRNVCIFADGEVDRSPTGTGVSARLAIHHARGEITADQAILVESIIGSRFKGRVAATTTFGPYDAVIPEIEGRAHITGRQEFLIDPTDELAAGFLLR
jgi:proline racemase